MKQVLFVLKEGQIAFWKYSRGSLARGTLNGNRWNDFTPSYWDEWSEANQAGDALDTILLSDKPNAFGTMPEWLQGGKDASAWTIEILSKMSKDTEFSDKGLVLSQGKTKFTLAQGDTVETYSLTSSLKFTLPKDEPEKEIVKLETPKPVIETTGIIGDSYNDPEALKLSVGDELNGTIVSVFKVLKRSYVKADGLKEQVCFKSADTAKFDVGDQVTLVVTQVNDGAKKVLFDVVVK